MRIFSLILFCIFYQNLPAQNIPVFQVLYAEKASLSNGTPLKNLDKLLDGTIHVADSGYLVLIHETGIPLEFSRDTTIKLNEIHRILDPPMRDREKKKINRSEVFVIRHSYQRTIGLDYLLITNYAKARITQLSRTGTCMDCSPNEGIQYPPLIGRRVYFDDDVKIIWNLRHLTNKPEPLSEFAVRFKNLLDDELRSIKVVGNKLILSKSEMIELMKGEPNVIFFVTDSYEHGLPGGVVMSPFYTKALRFPYSKEIKTASAALMAGYFYELASSGASSEAQSHYELATQLSDKQFYKEMLSNYLKRSSQ